MADPQVAPRWRLSLVIPAYNEEAGIRQAIAAQEHAIAFREPDPLDVDVHLLIGPSDGIDQQVA